jgi:DNA (cytosine-5)-methyltransferase 1
MRFIELFAGIGGFRLGLENTGHECVWANEILDKPRSIYERNFGEAPDGRDIRLVSGADLPEADILVGGFPCATFSVAGKRTGFSLEDTRGTLAFEMFRIAHERQIPYILFENVKGLLNHDGGKTFGIILSVLDEMGYDCQWELLDSQHFGIPQHRERVFLVANHRDFPRPKVFPIGREIGQDFGEGSGQAFQQSEAEGDSGAGRLSVLKNVPYATGRKPKDVRVFPTIDGHYWKGIQNNQGRGAVRAVLTPDREEKRQRGRRFKDVDEASFTITAQDRHGVLVEHEGKSRIRRLTPLECERLQGFPDGWTEFYADGKAVSDSERYERCGRTVTISVIEAIGRRLYDFWDESK